MAPTQLVESGPTDHRPTVHRRNRDLDIILFIFLILFISLEHARLFKSVEEDVPIAQKGSTQKEGDTTDIDTQPSVAVNWDWDHILSHQSNCTLVEDDNTPLPLVFMALGRTGSSVTWATVAKMTGDADPERSVEITGRIHTEATQFFNEIPDELGPNWPSAYICDLQSNFTERGLHHGLVGFQWKPYMSAFNTDKSLSGFRDLAAAFEAALHPRIRVVYQTRNAIDRRLSNWRHRGHGSEVPAHCIVGDEECIKEHERFSQMMNFTTGDELISWLNVDKDHMRRVIERLEGMDVDYIHVTYEKLYMGEDAAEWMRIFTFLGRGPKEGLTLEEVQKNFGMAKTSSKTHKDMMLNYDEVKKTLEGTEYEDLLN